MKKAMTTTYLIEATRQLCAELDAANKQLAKDHQYIADLEAEVRVLRATDKNVDYAVKMLHRLLGQRDGILTALAANDDMKDGKVQPRDETMCCCDPSVGMAPCRYCAIHDALVGTLRIIDSAALVAQEARPAPVIDMPATSAAVDATANRLLDIIGFARPGLPPIAAQEPKP